MATWPDAMTGPAPAMVRWTSRPLTIPTRARSSVTSPAASMALTTRTVPCPSDSTTHLLVFVCADHILWRPRPDHLPLDVLVDRELARAEGRGGGSVPAQVLPVRAPNVRSRQAGATVGPRRRRRRAGPGVRSEERR